ncbi:hypothetical protein [Paeniglutamicibacter sp. NPDC091659]|uniref:hypothetical protein n=1 Tax=Paeniglutamicibacter sp. NPDC091659 TaxID=3364389 RepID=UPI00380E2157
MAKKPPYVPQFPVVIAKISDHEVTVNGESIDLNGTPPHQAVISHIALTCAKPLDRPIRVLATDPSGTTRLIVNPDGTTTDIERAEEQKAAAPDARILIPATPALAATLEVNHLENNTVTGTLSNTETGSVETALAVSPEEFRNHAIAEAAQVAQSLSRPIRLHLLEEGNSTVLAVHPDAYTQQMAADGTLGPVQAYEATVVAEDLVRETEVEPAPALVAVPPRPELPPVLPTEAVPVESDHAEILGVHYVPDSEQDQKKDFPTRRALIIGGAAALLLGAGTVALNSLRDGHTNEASAPVDAPTPSSTPTPAPQPPVQGFSVEPAWTTQLTQNKPAFSRDGKYLAMKTDEATVDIIDAGNGKKIASLNSARTFNSDAIATGKGGFAAVINTAEKGPRLLTWAPGAKVQEHDVPAMHSIITRNGRVFISDNIPNLGSAKKTYALDGNALTTFVGPGPGPAPITLTSDAHMLWASLDGKKVPSLIKATRKGKIAREVKVRLPAKGASITQWAACSDTHLLMLWQTTQKKIATLHSVGTGKITATQEYKSAEGERLNIRLSLSGNAAYFAEIWADLETGKFTAPTGTPKEFDTLTFIPGGCQFTTGTEETLWGTNGKTRALPFGSNAIAVTDNAVFLQQGTTLSVHPTTPTN